MTKTLLLATLALSAALSLQTSAQAQDRQEVSASERLLTVSAN